MGLSLFLLLTTACKKEGDDTTDLQYRAIAWNYLSAEQKATVNTDWKLAPVQRPKPEDTQTVSVRFGTIHDAALGPFIVYVAIETKTVRGIGGRF